MPQLRCGSSPECGPAVAACPDLVPWVRVNSDEVVPLVIWRRFIRGDVAAHQVAHHQVFCTERYYRQAEEFWHMLKRCLRAVQSDERGARSPRGRPRAALWRSRRNSVGHRSSSYSALPHGAVLLGRLSGIDLPSAAAARPGYPTGAAFLCSIDRGSAHSIQDHHSGERLRAVGRLGSVACGGYHPLEKLKG